jgi:hypothetical protein
MKKADEMIGRLVKFIDKNPEYSLWILSSMGQQAVEAKEIYTDLFVTNGKKFMDNFDLGTAYYELKAFNGSSIQRANTRGPEKRI